MSTRRSLRATMLIPLIGALVAGSGGLGLFVYRAVERDLIASIDDELNRVLTGSIGQAVGRGDPLRGDPGGGADRQPGDLLDGTDAPIEFVVGPGGQIANGAEDAATFDDAQLDALAAARGFVEVDGEPRYRARVERLADGSKAVAALSLAPVDESLSSLLRNLILGGTALVILQTLVVLVVAGAVARPIGRISAVAHDIREGDLGATVPEPSGPRETAMLTEDLAAMLDRLRSTIDEREGAADEAERARDDMERFMADASHELRTPLTALRGYSDLYTAGMLEGDGLERAMRRIGAESQRLEALVTDLLQLVRPEDGSRFELVDVGAVVSAVAHDLRAAHPERTIELELSAAAPTVKADPARLHQAVLNLGANACHHTPPETNLTLRVGSDMQWAQIEVVDHGPGVDLATAERLFRPFVRNDASRSRRDHGGAGLGLALVDRIVRQHGGSVAVTETRGGGSTFTLRLPVASNL
ncbi:MAG: HAMP domain-containing sensor histidine kinase [Acidimicrobiales bacterium]